MAFPGCQQEGVSAGGLRGGVEDVGLLACFGLVQADVYGVVKDDARARFEKPAMEITITPGARQARQNEW